MKSLKWPVFQHGLYDSSLLIGEKSLFEPSLPPYLFTLKINNIFKTLCVFSIKIKCHLRVCWWKNQTSPTVFFYCIWFTERVVKKRERVSGSPTPQVLVPWSVKFRITPRKTEPLPVEEGQKSVPSFPRDHKEREYFCGQDRLIPGWKC